MIVKFGRKPLSSFAARTAEKVAGKDAGPGRLGVDAERPAVVGWAPMNRSCANRSRSITYLRSRVAQPVVGASLIGWLTSPHQTMPRSMARGRGLVLRRAAGVGPVLTTSGPSAAIRPSSSRTAIS